MNERKKPLPPIHFVVTCDRARAIWGIKGNCIVMWVWDKDNHEILQLDLTVKTVFSYQVLLFRMQTLSPAFKISLKTFLIKIVRAGSGVHAPQSPKCWETFHEALSLSTRSPLHILSSLTGWGRWVCSPSLLNWFFFSFHCHLMLAQDGRSFAFLILLVCVLTGNIWALNLNSVELTRLSKLQWIELNRNIN